MRLLLQCPDTDLSLRSQGKAAPCGQADTRAHPLVVAGTVSLQPRQGADKALSPCRYFVFPLFALPTALPAALPFALLVDVPLTPGAHGAFDLEPIPVGQLHAR